MDILEKIKKIQKEKGWNDGKLANAANLRKSTITSLYQRNNIPSIPTLQAICQAFGITVSQFFDDSNVPLDLTPEQKELLEQWNNLDDARKLAIMNLLKVM